jgi:catechol 2,3-dioxygenase-like lactoylglutathione lyase family enzyme
MLTSSKLTAFVGVRDPDRARAFYRDTLGLALVSEELPFALVFDASGTMLRVTVVPQVVAAPYTVLGWRVADIAETVKTLQQGGVHFERFPGLNDQHELGIWTAPGGTQIAWFKDPDGNLLSIAQH